MESFFTRYRNPGILLTVILAQVLALAVQVKRPTESGPTRLLRVWVVSAVTPLEQALVGTSQGIRGLWRNYAYLRGVRQQNQELKTQIEQMRVQEVRLREDAAQARRLQALLAFKEQFISETVAAQVIGTSGSDQSRVLYIDKGSADGIKPDMAVITPDGIVGKVLRVFHSSSQVLEIDDVSSGVGTILEKSRLQGILKGTAAGDTVLAYIMSDNQIAPGERVLTSGGDRIFPKGLPVGTVVQARPGSDSFLNIRVRPAANLSRLEEVLVVTKIVERQPETPEPSGPMRAADILAQRLPSVPQKPPAAAPGGATASGTPSQVKPGETKPSSAATAATAPKPANTTPAASVTTPPGPSAEVGPKPTSPPQPAKVTPPDANGTGGDAAASPITKPANGKTKPSPGTSPGNPPAAQPQPRRPSASEPAQTGDTPR